MLSNNLGMKKIIHLVLLLIISYSIFAQEEIKKEKFIKEKYIHFKVGATFNFVNRNLYKILNSSSSDVFTPQRNIFYNPSADIEFENHFTKYFGLSVNLGFMQTRQRYQYSNIGNPNAYTMPGYDQGLILCNIPHLNINPSFYITNSTRLYVSSGLYKYYYTFNPMNVGNIYFDLNSEGLMIYSVVGITQSFDIKRFRGTVSANYFGLTGRYDSAIQIALGIAL